MGLQNGKAFAWWVFVLCSIGNCDISQAHEHIEPFMHDGVIIEWQRGFMQVLDRMPERGRVEVVYAVMHFWRCVFLSLLIRM